MNFNIYYFIDEFNKNEIEKLSTQISLIYRNYNKKNEPLFSTLEMITVDGENLIIKGNEIIDNADMFKRAPIPHSLKWILPIIKLGSKFSTIDPYYTRFSSDLSISLDDTLYTGTGVLEIMDLK